MLQALGGNSTASGVGREVSVAGVVAPVTAEGVCPVCGDPLVAEKCKVVCRSERCVYRIVFNCSEF